MSAALWEVVPVALALALASLPVLLVPLALVTRRPRAVGLCFLLGWVVGVVVVGAAVMLLGDLLGAGRRPPDWWGWVLVGLGSALVVLAVRKFRGRARPDAEPEPPPWLARMESMSAGGALGLGFALVAANPKNLALVAAGASVIVEATSQRTERALALGVLAVVGSIGVALPVLLPLVLGARAEPVLAALDRWVTRYGTVLVSAVLLVLGLLLIGNGIAAS